MLASVVGADRVAAVDPSEAFVEACRQRVPGADVRLAAAEDLPFADSAFDGALSQLVVNFMSDPVAGVGEMRRVTRPGGTVAACVWDYAGEMTLLRQFWDAAVALDPAAAPLDEGASMPHCQPDSLRCALGVGRASGDSERRVDPGRPLLQLRGAVDAVHRWAWRLPAPTRCRWRSPAERPSAASSTVDWADPTGRSC